MTAALAHLTGSPLRSCSRGRGARILSVLALVLPVPVFAALGLSLPLPATVERIAAKLVPFVDSASLSALVGSGGAIVLAPGEGAADGSHAIGADESPTALVTDRGGIERGRGDHAILTTPIGAGPYAEPTKETTAAAEDADGPSAPVPRGADSRPAPPEGTTSASAPAPTPEPGGTTPGGDNDPGPGTPTVVDTATATATSAVGTVTTAVTNVATTAGETTKAVTDSAGSAVEGAVGGLLPPKP